ncbi:hypothetical protein ACE6H2_011015 [Prunus campanulata]
MGYDPRLSSQRYDASFNPPTHDDDFSPAAEATTAATALTSSCPKSTASAFPLLTPTTCCRLIRRCPRTMT